MEDGGKAAVSGSPAEDEVYRHLVELRAAEHFQEPLGLSYRPLIGRLLTFVRKFGFRFLVRWYVDPFVDQQVRFNRAASRLIQDLRLEVVELRRQLGTRNTGDSLRVDATQGGTTDRD